MSEHKAREPHGLPRFFSPLLYNESFARVKGLPCDLRDLRGPAPSALAESGVVASYTKGHPSFTAIQPHYTAARSVGMELRGLEPLTSWVRSRRSPS